MSTHKQSKQQPLVEDPDELPDVDVISNQQADNRTQSRQYLSLLVANIVIIVLYSIFAYLVTAAHIYIADNLMYLMPTLIAFIAAMLIMRHDPLQKKILIGLIAVVAMFIASSIIISVMHIINPLPSIDPTKINNLS